MKRGAFHLQTISNMQPAFFFFNPLKTRFPITPDTHSRQVNAINDRNNVWKIYLNSESIMRSVYNTPFFFLLHTYIFIDSWFLWSNYFYSRLPGCCTCTIYVSQHVESALWGGKLAKGSIFHSLQCFSSPEKLVAFFWVAFEGHLNC